MTKEQFGTDLMKKLQPMVEQFVSQPSPRALEAREKLAEIESKKAGLAKVLGDGSPAYKAAVRVLEDEEKNSRVNESFQRKQNLQLVAEAMIYVANELRIPLRLKDSGGPSAPASKGKVGSTGKRFRKTAESMKQESDTVLKALPASNGKFVSKIDLQEKLGFDPTSALLKLKRDGEAASNGMRGTAGGWRKA